jgi:SAM-dependent methyltransferase
VQENFEWLARIGRPIVFSGAHVLDLGCGHGALSIAIAQNGAKKVVGLDLDADRIDFAARNLNERFPELVEKVLFLDQDIAARPERGRYDLVVSKDSFEHIEDLESVTESISVLLKDGGKLIVGFSPLYYSPFGDHGRLLLPLPWLHALFPTRLLGRWASFRMRRKITNISDLGLNRLTPKQFRKLFENPKWRIVSLEYNRGSKLLMPIMRMLRRLPCLEDYFTVNIYAIIQLNFTAIQDDTQTGATG